MSIEADAKTLTFKEFQKKYGYKYTNVWVAENEIDYEPIIKEEENEDETTRSSKHN